MPIIEWGLRVKAVIISTMALFVLTSCSSFPRSGPDHDAIASGASIVVASKEDNDHSNLNYILVDLSNEVLGYFPDPRPTSLRDGFGGGYGPAPDIVLGKGDVIELTLFESSAGGLFIPKEAGTREGNFVKLPPQTIDSEGMITVPYAGRIRAAGRTTVAVEKEIVDTLANRAIEPQAVINIISSRSNEVAVLGDVGEPSKLEINKSGERILDVISRAGGIKTPSEETFITVQRRGRTATIPFDTLVAQPRENIYVRPGDTIYANRQRRTYVAFGASGLNGRIDFQESDLTLAEAVGQAGGLLDGRADPAQVFLYRTADRNTLARLGVQLHDGPGDDIPVIIRTNFRDPKGFFLAQKFRMRDKDVLYVSNSDSVELTKVLDLINSVSNTSASVPLNALTTNDAVNALAR